ncbi:hypothetical protein [Eubacterium sp.]|uniref:hypothetical protein n=1 Tax=Eubacterium sp. TaxID=142586 RepID=UPI0025D4ABA5|nr:hypothetical protein [Eubacterium sp.]MCR5628172.1 hypothetical protein [Eubacterium sp.]
MEGLPTWAKVGIGVIGAAIAITTGVGATYVATTMAKSAISGAIFNGAIYGVSSLVTGHFDKTELINSMLNGAADMFMISGVALGAVGLVKHARENGIFKLEYGELDVSENRVVNDFVNGKTDEVDGVGRNIIKNWKGEEVKIPDGHKMSPRDPDFSVKPITEAGPYTTAQREEFIKGNSAGTKLASHHRHQIPVRDGGVIDEIPGPGHPSGNQHTKGSPSRHPAKSIFNNEPNGNLLRANEIRQSLRDKGNRLIEVEPGVWIDPGF